MDFLKKPETLFIAFFAIALVVYIAYDYKKHSSQNEKQRQLEERLSATVRAMGEMSTQVKKVDNVFPEFVKLKERQDEIEKIFDKIEDINDFLDNLTSSLEDSGIEVEEIPKKKKKDKRKKKERRRKKEESSSESEDDGSERMRRIQERRKNGKR